MRARGIRRVPVVDARGRLVNILTLDEILVVLGEEIANMGRAVIAGISKEHVRGAAARRRAAASK
jgi:Mg/Co/Ni transporter MgtE